MGSWSVYCSISNIAITSGNKCVLLPLKKNNRHHGYLPYIPATLPIFGEYDDYGGLENIEINDNTKLIEEHFGVTIDEFAFYFTRGCIADDEDEFPKKLKEVDELKGWTFMFIDRQVYDFMSSYLPSGYSGRGHLDFGDEGILKLIGFEYVGKDEKNPTYDPKRFNQVWKFGKKKFYSDGRWLQVGKRGSIYNYFGQYGEGKKDETSLEHHIEIPEDKKWIGEKTMWELWEYLSKETQATLLNWVIGAEDRDNYMMRKFIEKFGDIFSEPAPTTIHDKYVNQIQTFGNGLSELVSIRHNLHPMSGHFAPYVLYLTPQCGEHELHQVLLDKFAEINKSYCEPEEEE